MGECQFADNNYDSRLMWCQF